MEPWRAPLRRRIDASRRPGEHAGRIHLGDAGPIGFGLIRHRLRQAAGGRRPCALTIRARHPDLPIAGAAVSFGEPDGQVAELACLGGLSRGLPKAGPFAAPSEALIAIPYTFAQAGVHRVTVLVVAGRCGGETRALMRTLTVNVHRARADRGQGRRALARAAAGCPGAFDRLTAERVPAARSATLCLLNAVRAVRGRAPLRFSDPLRRAASAHSADMVRRHYFAHQGAGGPALATRLRRARYLRFVTAGENLAAGTGDFSSPLSVVVMWWLSPGHRANMLDAGFREAGVGVVPGMAGQGSRGGTYTVDFGRRRPRG